MKKLFYLCVYLCAQSSSILRVKESRQCASKQAQGSQKGPKFAKVRVVVCVTQAAERAKEAKENARDSKKVTQNEMFPVSASKHHGRS
jgi:hypothetical protein